MIQSTVVVVVVVIIILLQHKYYYHRSDMLCTNMIIYWSIVDWSNILLLMLGLGNNSILLFIVFEWYCIIMK